MKNVKKLSYSNPTIVYMLEDALKLAKKGEIISCAVAWTANNGYTASAFYAPDRVMALLGELTVLERDIMEICIASRRDDAGM